MPEVRAGEVYKDREMLNRLGYGIMDIEWGKGELGSENIRNFSYVVAQDQDPKFYRRLVYDLVGRYFSNDLAKIIWDKFIEHKWVLSERAHRDVGLKVAADDWMKNYSHDFLKEWTFTHPVPNNRIRGSHEPNRGAIGAVASVVIPPLGDLLDSGFSVINVMGAAMRESLPLRENLSFHPDFDIDSDVSTQPSSDSLLAGTANDAAQPEATTKETVATTEDTKRPVIGVHFLRFINPFMSRKRLKNRKTTHPTFVIKKVRPDHGGMYYVRLLANLTGHHVKSREEAEHYWREVLENKWYMSERAGHDVGLRTAALDYFRRLNLLEQVETGNEV